MKNLIVSLVLVSLLFGPKSAGAQDIDILSSMFNCLHEAPLTKNKKVDEQAVLECTKEVLSECYLLDIRVTDGIVEHTGEECLSAFSEQTRSKMTGFLHSNYPDVKTTGHHLRKLAIEYANKRAKLGCEFLRDFSEIPYQPWLRDLEQKELDDLNRLEASCLFQHLVTSYWKVVVHDQMK